MYTVQKLSKAAGISADMVRFFIKKGSIQARKIKGAWAVSDSEAERTIKKYKPSKKWEPISVSDAKRKLGYSARDALRISFNKYDLPRFIINRKMYIPVEYVKAAERQLMETGHIRVNWRKIHKELNYK